MLNVMRISRRLCPLIKSRINVLSHNNSKHLSQTTESQANESQSSAERQPIPRRALLYVPGDDERKIAKLSSLDVDCIVLDCEDGVAINKKVSSHSNALKYMLINRMFECMLRKKRDIRFSNQYKHLV